MKWLIALHIVAVVCWFAALFYLPRLFVYHAMADEKAIHEQFKVMEYKLYYYIMWPACIATFITGFALVFFPLPLGYWLKAKLVLVAILFAFHLRCGHYLRLFREDKNPHPHRFYRWFNEAPTILLFAIVILAVVRPI